MTDWNQPLYTPPHVFQQQTVFRISPDVPGPFLPELLAQYGSCYPRKYAYETYFDDNHREHVRVSRTYPNGYYESGEPDKYVR